MPPIEQPTLREVLKRTFDKLSARDIAEFLAPPGVVEAVRGQDMSLAEAALVGVLGKAKKGRKLFRVITGSGEGPKNLRGVLENITRKSVAEQTGRIPNIKKMSASKLISEAPEELQKFISDSIGRDIQRNAKKIDIIRKTMPLTPVAFTKDGQSLFLNKVHGDMTTELSIVNYLTGERIARITSENDKFILHLLKPGRDSELFPRVARKLGEFRTVQQAGERLTKFLERRR